MRRLYFEKNLLGMGEEELIFKLFFNKSTATISGKIEG